MADRGRCPPSEPPHTQREGRHANDHSEHKTEEAITLLRRKQEGRGKGGLYLKVSGRVSERDDLWLLAGRAHRSFAEG